MEYIRNFSSEKSQLQTQKKNNNIDPEIKNKIQEFTKQLKAIYSPDSNIETDYFPSGSIMINVHRHDRFFVLAYSPKQGFGVDEVKEDDGFDSGYSFITQNSEQAFKQLMKIIAS